MKDEYVLVQATSYRGKPVIENSKVRESINRKFSFLILDNSSFGLLLG
ncbi:MAG: hypothetical protein KME05_06835 [Gloeocapsa sp. UFS-A4-WI-NPMV-4B04]|jgi:hypothetical protein|nr:hypothetical protein [Gloeocapsa sp. UFS-A4-WI-NPMV-4B04]